jgi:hypothetical protein
MWKQSRSAPGGTERGKPGVTPAGAESGLSDTQLMRMLEQRRAVGAVAPVDEQSVSHVPVLRPEDTGTRRALKEAVSRADPVSFAVQLLWSPQEIDLYNVPRDPIFSSYTVYTTRVRHSGRQWFELRMGFFADVLSAKQVAVYMRSEYHSAAVVPVTTEEQAAARASRGSSGRRGADARIVPNAPQPAAARWPRLTLVRRAGGKSQ